LQNHKSTALVISFSVALGGGPVKTMAWSDADLFFSEIIRSGWGFAWVPVGF